MSPRARLFSLSLVLLPLLPLAVVVSVVDGCGSSSATAADAPADAMSEATAVAADAQVPEAAVPDDAKPAGCPRMAAAADRARKVVVSHPFGADGGKTTAYEVVDLAADGTLSHPSTPVTFAMGTALSAPIVFTPDGEVGLVAQDDGSVGVFRLPAGGAAPVVVHAAFKGAFSAGGVVLAPDGARAWILDPNTEKNGGGVFEVAIHCDGTLAELGRVVPGGGATAMALLPGSATMALVAAQKAFDSPATNDLHLVDLGAGKRVSSTTPFGDLDPIVSSIAVMADGKYALVADDGPIVGSRVAVVGLVPMLAPVAILQTPFPAAVVASPFGNAAIVMNDDSTDQIHVLSYDPSKPAAPFVITGELAYKFGKPQIPVTASVIDRGALKGSVFIGENTAVRKVVFMPNGTVVDGAKLSFAGGLETVIGVVGVQP